MLSAWRYRKNSLNPLSGIGLGYGANRMCVIMPRDRVTGHDAGIRCVRHQPTFNDQQQSTQIINTIQYN